MNESVQARRGALFPLFLLCKNLFKGCF